jgi:ubiquinone biosynthesis monooxygenase Coq7
MRIPQYSGQSAANDAGLIKFKHLISQPFINDSSMPFIDRAIADFDNALRVITGQASASRPNPALQAPDGVLDAAEQRHSAGLMRINHVGEVCAQALYDAQGRFAQGEPIKQQFAEAGREEEDHLAWTAERLRSWAHASAC